MNINDRPDSFEDRLLSELQQEVVRRQEAAPVVRPQWRRARYLGVAAAVLLAAGVPAFSWVNATPAFAVEPAKDGAVKVSVNRLDQPEDLEKALEAKGIKADVTYTPAGKQCAPGRYQEAPAPDSLDLMSAETSMDGKWAMTISPKLLRAGETLVLESSWSGNDWSMSVGTAVGEIGPCNLVDSPKDEMTAPTGDSSPGTVVGKPVCDVSELPEGVPTEDFVPDESCQDK